ncbi:hypothetical protein Tco_0698604 [Tanacetum coccineum]
MILATQSYSFKQENVIAERLHGLDQQMERKGDKSLYFMDRIWVLLVGSVINEAHASRYLVHPGADKTYHNLGDMYCLRYLRENEDSVSLWDFIQLKFRQVMCSEYDVIWVNGIGFWVNQSLRLIWMISASSLVLADAAESVRDAIGFEYCLASSSGWTKLRLPEELNSVHDTFHVSNLKKCLADANLHVPLDEIRVDKTLRFVEEPVEIMDKDIKKLKRRNIELVKVRWNLKRGPKFTWEHGD